jgi:phage shock protein E
MNSAILFLIIAVLILLFIIMKSRATKSAIGKYLKNNALGMDVRSKQEFSQGHFASAVNIPIDRFEARLGEVGSDKDRPVILYCHAGSRAALAETILKKNGFSRVINARNRDALRKCDTNPAKPENSKPK